MSGMIFAGKRYSILLILVLACYACARILEVWTGPVPRLSLVALDVLSALAFALIDGSRNYGTRIILVFAVICALIGNAMENLGLATGFPFGHYRFLEVMGPRIFAVPVLLGLAYIGMAYVSWMLARTVTGEGRGGPGMRALATPLLASVIMVAWDLAQDPVWSTFLHAWVWRDGGPWFGVPVSNYFGWLLTDFLIFLLFAFYLRRSRVASAPEPRSAVPALIFYALCAGGNVLQVLVGPRSAMVQDATGKSWYTTDILAESAAVSICVMGLFVLLAASRLLRGATN